MSCSSLSVKVLGCGPASGVPTMTGDWGKCDPKIARNHRLRPSILLSHINTETIQNVLVDTTPDLRTQMIESGSPKINSVLYTHEHADHVHGIDDLRALFHEYKESVNVFASDQTMAEIRRRFDYIFENRKDVMPWAVPQLNVNIFETGQRFETCGLSIMPIQQNHGLGSTHGFRIGEFAYSSDVWELDEAALKALEGIKVWIVDALSDHPHPTHSHVQKTLGWIKDLGVERAWFTHMNKSLDYKELCSRLPQGVEPAWDGLVIEGLNPVW